MYFHCLDYTVDLLTEIEKTHSRRQAEKIAHWVGSDARRFASLMQLFLNGEYHIAQRAGWPISICAEAFPGLVKPHLGKMLDNLSRLGIHDAVKRNTVRIMQFVPIATAHQGKAATICFNLLHDKNEAIAVRAFAMSVVFNLCKAYPELAGELKAIIEMELAENPKPAFKSRGSKILKALGA